MNLTAKKMMSVFAFGALVSLALTSGLARASAAHDYECIAQGLEAYDSDNFYNVSPADIDALLANVGDGYHFVAVRITQQCDADARAVCNDGLLEAKFLGHIENLNYSQDSEAGNMPHTTFGIGKFLSYTPNPFCGLDAAQAEKAIFWTQGQSSLRNGQELAGKIRYSKLNGRYILVDMTVAPN